MPPAGLAEVRALAKAAPPAPGSLPPSALPRLQPLAPQHLLLLPPPPPPPSQPPQPPPPPQLYHAGRGQPLAAACEGPAGGQAVEAADMAGPATTTTSTATNTATTTSSSSVATATSALFGGPPAHPHLEDQLIAVAQWEQVGGRVWSGSANLCTAWVGAAQ